MIKIYVMSTCPNCTEVKQLAVGLPVFVKEDGTVKFKSEEVGLVGVPAVYETGASCNLEGSGF